MNAQPNARLTARSSTAAFARRTAMTAAILAALAVSATANSLYWGGGTDDITDGTPLPTTTAGLTGGWNATTKNWATAPNGATYTTWTDGAFVQLGHYTDADNATITLDGNVEPAALVAGMNATTGNNRRFILTASSPVTWTVPAAGLSFNPVSQDGTRGINVDSDVRFAGSSVIEKIGNGQINLLSDSPDFTGTILSRQGSLNIGASGAFAGVKRIHLFGRLTHPTSSGYGGNDFARGDMAVSATAGANDKLADDAVIVMRRGSFDYRPNATSTETISRIESETWGVIGSGEGSTGGILTLGDATAGLTRGSTGRGLLVFGSLDGATTRLKLRVPNGVATDTLLPWLISSRGEFTYLDSTDNNTLTRIVPTEAATDLSQWTTLYGVSDNLRIGDDTSVTLGGSVGDDLTLRSLAFFNRTATQLTIADGKTLTLESGGLVLRTAAAAQNQTISGGSLTSGTGELLLHGSDSGHSQNLVIQSTIVGSGMEVVKAGMGGIQLAGSDPNTFSGGTHVLSGGLTLAKTAGVNAIGGDLDVYAGGSVNWTNNDQIPTTANVTIHEEGLISLRNQTFGGTLTLESGTLIFPNATLTFNKVGTGLVFNGGWLNQSSSHTGNLNLETDVRYEATATRQARWELSAIETTTMGYNIRLNGGNRTFDIADSATLAEVVPEMVIDTAIIPGSPAGGAITKTGDGVLQLTGPNTYTGGTTVNGGTLHVATISGPAQSGLTGYTGSAGSGQAIVTFLKPVATNMVARQPILGTGVNANRIVARVISDYEILVNGNNSAAGVATDLAVSAVSRSGSLGTGAATVNNSGSTLQVDAGIALVNDVTVNTGAKVAASGATLGSLAVNAGAVAVDLAQGVTTITGAATLSGAALEISGEVEEPVVVLTTGSLTGTFATWTEGYKVTYDGNSVLVGPASPGGMVIIVR